jgi:transcriptional regulator with PAS, ATPase and Fis domain
LEADVEAGRFRRDLFYRINVFAIHIPPLRERIEDVALLADAFLEEFIVKTGKDLKGISKEALEILFRYSWPGNIRELRNVVERAVILEKSKELTPASLPEGIRSVEQEDLRSETLNLRESLKAEERRVLKTALEAADGVKREAAKMLGIDERNLSYYLKKHGLTGRKPEK